MRYDSIVPSTVIQPAFHQVKRLGVSPAPVRERNKGRFIALLQLPKNGLAEVTGS